jgi:hypothetical protein
MVMDKMNCSREQGKILPLFTWNSLITHNHFPSFRIGHKCFNFKLIERDTMPENNTGETMTLTKSLLSAALLTLSVAAIAQNDISLGLPGYGGNGCPAGSASVTLSPDAKSLSLIFDQFITEAGPNVGKTLDRKSCNIAIPVHVPQGFSISIIAVDYRGFVALPRNATARLSAEYFFAGMTGPRFVKDFRGIQNSDYTFNNTLGVAASVWSPCGVDVNLRVNANMMLTNRGYEDAMATVDSADISAGIIYQIQTRRCH